MALQGLLFAFGNDVDMTAGEAVIRYMRHKCHGKGKRDIISLSSRIKLHQEHLSNGFKIKQKERLLQTCLIV